MTQPGESPTDVALRFLGQQVETLRKSMHDELAAMRGDIGILSADVRNHIPKIAVLEHVVAEQSKDIAELQRQREQDRADEKAGGRAWRVAIAAAVIGALVAIVFGVLNLTVGG